MSKIQHLSGQKYIACIGDSKTAGLTGYIYQLLTYLEGRTGNNWNLALHHAVGGWTVANALSGLPAALDTAIYVPTYVFIDLGVNEANDNPLPNEASWKANYASLLDQLHTKWPEARIYVAKIWRGDDSGIYIANCATINAWIEDVISDGRSGWVSVAHNEADWLDTWSLDKVHPDARIGGYAEMARQWFAALF